MLSRRPSTSKSRTERPRKTKIGTEVAHVTRDSETTFRVKGQGHQTTLPTAVLSISGQRGNVETAATLLSARPREALRRPLREERGGAK